MRSFKSNRKCIQGLRLFCTLIENQKILKSSIKKYNFKIFPKYLRSSQHLYNSSDSDSITDTSQKRPRLGVGTRCWPCTCLAPSVLLTCCLLLIRVQSVPNQVTTFLGICVLLPKLILRLTFHIFPCNTNK